MKVWIARDADGGLFMYDSEPNRKDSFFMTEIALSSIRGQWPLPEGLLREVTWVNSPKEFEMVMDIFELKAQIKEGEQNNGR